MIKKVIHKLLSVTLAFLVLFSTLSFKVEKHYCGPFLLDTAIFTSAEKCSMHMSMEDDHDHENEKSCCNDEVEIFQGQDELKTTAFDTLDLDQQLFLTTYIYTYNNLFESLPKRVIPHKDYSPPNLIRNIQTEDQVFLI